MWCLHTSHILHHWGDGTGSHNLLQKAGGHARPETTDAVLHCYQLAKMQAILCRCPIIHHVHSWDQIILQQTHYGTLILPSQHPRAASLRMSRTVPLLFIFSPIPLYFYFHSLLVYCILVKATIPIPALANIGYRIGYCTPLRHLHDLVCVSVLKAGLKTETWLLYCLRLRSRLPLAYY